MKVFDVHDVPAAVDRQLAVADNPRHRHILKNFRRHALLEVSGLWPDILVPAMTVEHPVYRMAEGGQTAIFDGMAAVTGFYRGVADAGGNVFGPLEEEIAVTDHGIFSEALFAHVVPGDSPALAGAGADPNGFYQVSNYIAMSWPYQDGRLLGEHVYEDASSRTILQIDSAARVSPAQAREILAPYLADSPLDEIQDGLTLFSNHHADLKRA